MKAGLAADEEADSEDDDDMMADARANSSDNSDVKRDVSPSASRAMNEERRAKLREIEVVLNHKCCLRVPCRF